MSDSMLESAVLGGGCFWCLEAVYQEVPGVEEVISGYAGGHSSNPSYREVCSGRSGHAEVVELRFDPSVVSFTRLLEIFFTIHDPTTLNRQGADVGTQYRSVVFYQDDTQKKLTEETIARLEAEGLWDQPVVTQVEPLETFYPAEVEHQNYFARNGSQPYCQVVIQPKVAKYRKKFLSTSSRG